MLRHRLRPRPRRLSSTFGLDEAGVGSGPEGRLKRMRQVVGALFRYERLESTYPRCDEARGYAERLIQIAMKHGDKHKPTMEMADYWLEEKDLIHKLFKVLVPRYKGYRSSYTDIWKLPVKYPGDGRQLVVFELKGNPYPPVVPKVRNKKNYLSNILLDAAREDYQFKFPSKTDSVLRDPAEIKTGSQTASADRSQIENKESDQIAGGPEDKYRGTVDDSKNSEKLDNVISGLDDLEIKDKQKNS